MRPQNIDITKELMAFSSHIRSKSNESVFGGEFACNLWPRVSQDIFEVPYFKKDG